MQEQWRGDDGRLTEGHPLAASGGEAKAARLSDARDALLIDWGELTDESSCEWRLDVLGTLAARGLLSGSQAGAAVRACEVWLKARALKIEGEGMAALERRIVELQAALAAARQGR